MGKSYLVIGTHGYAVLPPVTIGDIRWPRLDKLSTTDLKIRVPPIGTEVYVGLDMIIEGLGGHPELEPYLTHLLHYRKYGTLEISHRGKIAKVLRPIGEAATRMYRSGMDLFHRKIHGD